MARHVRTAAGAAFFKRPIGSPITEGEYAAAKQARVASEVQEHEHQDLLDARRDARAKYEPGHPERLKAERAVRQSRKTRGSSAEPAEPQGHAADAIRDEERRKQEEVPFQPKRREVLESESVLPYAQQLRKEDIAKLTSHQRKEYQRQLDAGMSHGGAIAKARKGLGVSPSAQGGSGVTKVDFENADIAIKAHGLGTPHVMALRGTYASQRKLGLSHAEAMKLVNAHANELKQQIAKQVKETDIKRAAAAKKAAEEAAERAKPPPTLTFESEAQKREYNALRSDERTEYETGRLSRMTHEEALRYARSLQRRKRRIARLEEYLGQA